MDNDFFEISEFPEHYGRFPYIIHRMFYAIYKQVPIHFSEYHEPGELPGLTVRLDTHEHHGPEVLHSEAMRDRLKDFLRQYKTDMEAKYKADQRVCLVFGPSDCFYLSGDKETISDAPPSGGTLCAADGKPMMMGRQNHWRDADNHAILYRKPEN